MKKIWKSLVSVTLIFSFLIGIISGYKSSAASTMQSRNIVYFGEYFQNEVTDEEYLSRLRKADWENDEVTIENISFARKDGHYFYKSAVAWDILDSDADYYLLLSDKILTYHTFSDFWNVSDIRTWLNSDFYDDLFSTDEKNQMTPIVKKTKYYPYDDAYINNKDPQYIETSDYVSLLDENEVQQSSYGFDDGTEESDSRIAKCTKYANLDEIADRWWVRGPAIWSYGNLQEKYVSGKGTLASWYGTYSYGVRPIIRVKKTAVSTEKPESDYKFSVEEYDIEKNAIDAVPDLSDLGQDSICGPEISVNDAKFNLWKTQGEFSIDIKKVVTAKYCADDQTVEVLIGLPKEIKTPDPSENKDTLWLDTYKEIKSMVQACGKETTAETWNKFEKTRKKLKEFDSKAIYKASGRVAGYIKFQLDAKHHISGILESGLVMNLEVGASVKNPLFWVVYSEFGLSGEAEGQLYVDYVNSYQMKGSIKGTFKPSVAVGADVFVADVKGGLKGSISGKVTFPWQSFQKNVSALLSGEFFVEVDTIFPGLNVTKSWEWPEIELYPELGKVNDSSLSLGYSDVKPIKLQNVLKTIQDDQYNTDMISMDKSASVYENANPSMIRMENGKYLLVYLDEVNISGQTQVKLVYRMGDGENWSDPQVVNNKTTIDTAGKIKKCNGKYYVIYEGTTSNISSEQSEKDIVGKFDVYVSAFNDAGVITNDMISTSQCYKYNYDIVVQNGGINAVWAENDANSIMLEEGNTTVYQKEYVDSKWKDTTTLFSVQYAVDGLSIGVFQDKISAAYIYDDHLYINGNEKYTGLGREAFDSARIYEGKVYLRVGGMLCSYNGSNGEKTGIACGSDYIVNNSSVYWLQQMNFESAIYSQSMTSNVPVTLAEESTYIHSFELVENGSDPGLIYTSQIINENTNDNPYGVTLLKYKNQFSVYDADIESISYNALDIQKGHLNEITFEISNRGTEDLHNIKLHVDEQGNSLYSDVVLDFLEAGDTKTVDVELMINNSTVLESYLSADEKLTDKEKTKANIEIPGIDISIERENEDSLIVKNKSEEKAENIICVIKDSQHGEIIRKESIDALPSGGEKIINLEKNDWLKAKRLENKDYMLYCEVSCDGEELWLSDNSVCIIKTYAESDEEPISTPNANGGTNSKNTYSPSPTNSPKPNGDVEKRKYEDSTVGIVRGIKIKNKSRGCAMISWKKNNASGYEIQYALNKKFNHFKKKRVNGYTNKVNIKKLKKGEKYYFRIRAYSITSNKKKYGKWSAIKKIKIKK